MADRSDDTPASFSGYWDDGDPLPFFDEAERQMVFIVGSFNVFGVSWYAESYQVKARIVTPETEDGIFSAALKATTPMTWTKSEWWRRTGYYVLRPCVRAWRWLRGRE